MIDTGRPTPDEQSELNGLRRELAELKERFAERGALLAEASAQLQLADEHRQWIENDASESAARFHSLIEHAPDLIIIVDGRGRIRYHSSATGRHLGYGESDLVERDLFTWIHPDDLPDIQSSIRRPTRSNGHSIRLRCRFAHLHGTWRVFDACVTNLKADPAIGGYVINARDITDQVAAERGLLEAEQQLQAAQFEILERLAQAAEFRDDDTGQHTRRVGEIAGSIARALGLPAEDIERIRRAAPLHDVGKIAIPDSLLLAPRKLTATEYEVMKGHTLSGERMLAGSMTPMVQEAREIAVGHHERWDGKGYPYQVKGDAIPLPARIVAVADFFDAVSHDRPYRSAWPVDRVLQAIHRGRGSHFDPVVVDAFLTTLTDPPPVLRA